MREYRQIKRNGRAMPTPSGERFLTKEEVAERLQISVRTLETWMRQRRVRFFKISRCVRFHFSNLVEDLKTNCEICRDHASNKSNKPQSMKILMKSKTRNENRRTAQMEHTQNSN